MDTVMDIDQAYRLIYSDPRHIPRRNLTEPYDVNYSADGRIQIRKYRPNSRLTYDANENNPGQMSEAEFRNSTLLGGEIDHQRMVEKTALEKNLQAGTKSEEKFLSGQRSDTIRMQSKRPSTAEPFLSMMRNVANDGVREEINASDETLNHIPISGSGESQERLPVSREHSPHATSSKKSVAFSSNLVEEQDIERNPANISPSPKRSLSPNRSSLRTSGTSKGSYEIVSDQGKTDLQSNNENLSDSTNLQTRKSRTSMVNPPSTFVKKRPSKIPILKRGRGYSPLARTSPKSSDHAGVAITPSAPMQAVGIVRIPSNSNMKRGSKGELRKRESVKQIIEASKNAGASPHVQKSVPVMMTRKSGRGTPATTNSVTNANRYPGPSSSSTNTTPLRSLQSNKSLTKIATAGTKVQPERDARNEQSSEEIRQQKNNNNNHHGAESTTVVYKLQNQEGFRSQSTHHHNDENHSLEESELPSPLKITLPLSDREVTLALIKSKDKYGEESNEKGASESMRTSEAVVKVETKKSLGAAISCRFRTAGCLEELRKGSVDEGDHIACCPYRPLHCLFNPGVCEEAVPYHNFLLHLKSHYLEPNYGRALTTQVLVTKEDFQFNQNWYPKWLSWEEMHFFILLSHKRGKSPGVNGTWLCWVQMFGTKEEAVDFYYEIEVFKGPTKKLSGRFTVQPIRTSKEEIFKSKSGLAFTDKTTKQITGIGDLQLTDFYVDVSISRKPLSHKRNPSYTGAYGTRRP